MPAPPNESPFCSQDIRAQSRSITAESTHEQLDLARFESPGQYHDTGRVGTHQPSDIERAQETPMTFGKANLGKKFEEVWVTDPNWIKWFLGHYMQPAPRRNIAG